MIDKPAKKRVPKKKPKQIFSFLGGRVSILTDGLQWILIDKGDRSYYTDIDLVFKVIVKSHIHELSYQNIDDIRNVSDAISCALKECSAFAESVRDDASRILHSFRDQDEMAEKDCCEV